MTGTAPFEELVRSVKRLAGKAARLLRTPSAAAILPHPSELQIHPFDLQYGTDTSGFIVGSDLATGHAYDPYNTAYYAMSPSRFGSVIDRWSRETAAESMERYAFIDLGCGKGRAVLMASRLPFREVIGVELHAELAQIAQANAQTWVAAGYSVTPIRIVCQEATEFRFPPGPCLLYLFHPFSSPVIDRLLDCVGEHFEDRPEMLDIVYFNPEGEDQIKQHRGFSHLWTEVLPISTEDAAVDPLANKGDLCSAYRWVGDRRQQAI